METDQTANNIKFVFFGTPDRAVFVLDELKNAGLMPSLIVTQPDRPSGRNLALSLPPVKQWALREKIRCLQPADLDAEEFKKELRAGSYDAFVVVAYGKILKRDILEIPRHGSLNLHASLLPRLRGSCPIESAILSDEKETGVSIILMDERMDHGPVLAQKKADLKKWPLPADELARMLTSEGGKLFAGVLPLWIKGKLKPKEQDHSKATYTKKIVKDDGLIDLSSDPYKNYLKFNAFKGWPGIFFFKDLNGKKTRINIADAAYKDGSFVIKKVIPEGKREMSWSDFIRHNQ